MSDSESETVRVPRNDPLFRREGAAVPRNPDRSGDDLLASATEFVDGKSCSVCGKQADGVGDGVFYCFHHWCIAFDEMELRMSKKNNSDG